MTEKFNINNYNNVKVEKLGNNSLPLRQDDVQEQDVSNNNPQLQKVPVEVVSDSDTEFDEDEITTDSELGTSRESESDSDSENGSTSSTPLDDEDEKLVGGAKEKDTDSESISSVSTTEILSKDPLFLVLSEFLMDDETGSNIVHVGNDIVKVLSKINSKLGRIADVLEKKQSKNKHRKDN